MSHLSDLEDPENENVFNTAAKYLTQIVDELDKETLLQFYGLYKQATIGACNIPKPGMFAIQAKAKWKVWSDLKQMSKGSAMQLYVHKLSEIKSDWKAHADIRNMSNQQWVAVSRPQIEDNNEISESQKTCFDYVKEGNVDKLRQLLAADSHHVITDINAQDDSGLALVHWAADRGNVGGLEVLLKHGANVNIVDGEGQTALHYAASVGQVNCVKLLIKFGADRTICDASGNTCIDVADNETNISELLKS